MDLVKIGKYIASKRKATGLTQKQLAEQLGMSDKSVSKWERGICLPDVSLYTELCKILGITINEFIAGEDIPQEDIVKQSEDNIINVTEDSRSRLKNLKGIIAILTIIVLLAMSVFGIFLFKKITEPKNYIYPLAPESTEMKVANLMAGIDGAFLFKYHTKDNLPNIKIYMSIYKDGELKSHEPVTTFASGEPANKNEQEGIIAIIPDYEDFEIKIVIAESGEIRTSFPIMQSVKGRDYMMRAGTTIDEKLAIKPGEKQELAAIIFAKDDCTVVTTGEIARTAKELRNDYTYLFSFEFEK